MSNAVGIVVLSAALALAGCTTGEEAPPSSATTSTQPPKPALSLSGAKAFYRTHDVGVATARNAAYGKAYDRSRLPNVFIGPELDASILQSRVLQAQRKTTKVKPSTSVRQVYAGLSDDGAQDVVAAVSVSKKSWEGLRLLRRAEPGGSWRTALSVETSLATLPEPADPAGAMPSSADRSRARSVVAKVAKFIDGAKASGFVAGAAVDHIRKFDTEEETMVATKKTRLWGEPTKDGTKAGGPIVVLRTGDGMLVLAAFETAVSVKPRYGGPIFYRAPYDKVFGVSGNRPSITNYYAVGVAITFSGKKTPVVIGAQGSTVLPPARR